MRIRAILFDLGDTLFRLHPLPDVTPRIAAALAGTIRCGLPEAHDQARAVLEEVRSLRAANDGLLENDLESLFVGAMARRGLPEPEGLGRLAADVLGDADLARLAAGPHVAEVLGEFLKCGLLLGAVSNTTTRAEGLDGFLEATGIRPHLRSVVYSSSHGYRKPHASIYEAALATLGVHPGEAVFVGDRVREDVVGPQRLGMSAVLTHEFRHEATVDAVPLAVISELRELHQLLDAIRSA